MLFELLCDLKGRWLPRLVKCGVAAALALCSYTALVFASAANGAVSQSFSRQAQFDLYGLADTFMSDPDAFYDFRQSEDDLRALASFNDGLSTCGLFTFLSIFNQPVPILDFKGGPEFGYSYGVGQGTDAVELPDGVALNAKSVQMNRAAFEFYGLRISSGVEPDWSEVDYTRGRVPVLLGAKYNGVYSPGDVLVASFYGHTMAFEVAGLLESGSSVLFMNDPAYGLDYSIVVPYPESFASMGQLGDGFNGIVMFAYLNGDIAVPKGAQVEDLLDRLDCLGQETGFSDYGLAGLYDYSTKMALIRRLIVENVELVARMMVLAAGIGCLVIAAADWSICRYRERRRCVAVLLGRGLECRRAFLGIEVAWWALTMALIALGACLLPYQNVGALFSVEGALVVACLFDLGVCRAFERRAER